VAQSLRDSLRNCDLSFRYGGEEFLVILPETGLESALAVAERIRLVIFEQTSLTLAGIAQGITVSVGVATCPRDGHGDALLKEVDDQLYRAKREGKNRVYFRAEEGS
jgi:diguanylate cyclase (GGDEF)-like protein